MYEIVLKYVTMLFSHASWMVLEQSLQNMVQLVVSNVVYGKHHVLF